MPIRDHLASVHAAVADLGRAPGRRRSRRRPGAKKTWDFESDEPGKIAEGFTAEVGRWEVVQDGDNHVLAQKAKNDDATFNVALVEGTSYKDVDLSVRLRAVAGEIDRGGGLVWRARDAKNYYIARYNPLEDNFRVYKVEDGKRTQFRSAKVPGDDKWHTLRVTMTGPKITCYLDGKKLPRGRRTRPSPTPGDDRPLVQGRRPVVFRRPDRHRRLIFHVSDIARTKTVSETAGFDDPIGRCPVIRRWSIRRLMLVIAGVAPILGVVVGLSRIPRGHVVSYRVRCQSRLRNIVLVPLATRIARGISRPGPGPTRTYPPRNAWDGMRPSCRISRTPSSLRRSMMIGRGMTGRTRGLPMSSSSYCTARIVPGRRWRSRCRPPTSASPDLGPSAPFLPRGHPRAGVFGYDRQTSLKDLTDGALNDGRRRARRDGIMAVGRPGDGPRLDTTEQLYVGAGRQFGGLHRHGRRSPSPTARSASSPTRSIPGSSRRFRRSPAENTYPRISWILRVQGGQ